MNISPNGSFEINHKSVKKKSSKRNRQFPNKDEEVKQWSRIVGSSKTSLECKQEWPSLCNQDPVSKSPQVPTKGKSFLDVFKVKDSIGQIPYNNDKETNKSPNVNVLNSNISPSNNLDESKNNTLQNIDNWEVVKQKKQQKKAQKQTKNDVPNSDKDGKNETNSRKKSKSKNKEKTTMNVEIDPEIAEANRVKKQLLKKERLQKRQQRILKEREAARSDTKVNLISPNVVEALQSQKDKTQNKQASKFKYKSNDYPSLRTNVSKDPLPQETVKHENAEKKKNLTKKFEAALEEIPESKLSYSSAVSAIKNINLTQIKPPDNPATKAPKGKKKKGQKNAEKKISSINLYSFVKSSTNKKKTIEDEENVSTEELLPKKESYFVPSTAKGKKIGSAPIKLHRGRVRECKKKKMTIFKKKKLQERKRRACTFIELLDELKRDADKINEEKSSFRIKEIKEEEVTEKSDQEKILTIKEEPILKVKEFEIKTEATATSNELEKPPTINRTLLELSEEIKELQNSVHRRKFREYCNHCVTPEINDALSKLVEGVVRFQERAHHKDPIKAKARRRYYCGLKETCKHMNKLTCIILTPNVQRGRGPGGLDEKVQKVIDMAKERGVPVIFGLSSQKLAKLCFKKAYISCVAIVNYQGVQDEFNKVMELIPTAKLMYENLLKQGHCIPSEDEEENDNKSASNNNTNIIPYN